MDHESPTAVPKASDFEDGKKGLKDIERLGLEALRLRQSERFVAAKTDRPRAGERWGMPGCTTVVPTPTERARAVAEVQHGLGWPASVYPDAGVSFSYDSQTVTLSTPADPSASDLEALWRDPAMGALGWPRSERP
ncbi:hypothetical protein [Streptomyces hiroshimensis]|uniref:hypothetical protein n=1 Tax=Streptomyces hiroshimensis TaxID=66424 RepID=UPI0016798D9B|nr:hypothetical protein [Streptomyces hiroshimensis]